MIVRRRASEFGSRAGGGAQGGDDGVSAVADGHIRGIRNGVDGGSSLLATALGGDGDVSAVLGRGEHIAIQVTV